MFKIEFATDNAAFDDHPQYEVARILRMAADRVADGNTSGQVRDGNGNTVGTWEFTANERGEG